MSTVHEEWLSLTKEDPINPAVPICDSHHHLWGAPPKPSSSARPVDTYVLDDFLADVTGGHNVVSSVFVECGPINRGNHDEEMAPAQETEFVCDLISSAKRTSIDVAAGIVGFADLTLGAGVQPLLEEHIEAGEGRFRGIRQSCTWDASPEIVSRAKMQYMLLDRTFQKGFALLDRYNLSFDAWLYHPQMIELAALARAFPHTTIILNHLGGPLGIGPYAGKLKDTFQEWKRGIEALAECQNVLIKLGGMGMPLCGFNWSKQAAPPGSAQLAEILRPYFLTCIEKLGANRCMFESDFPMDKISYSYIVIWNAFKRIVKDFSSSEQSALFYETAVRAYRLDHK